MPEENYGSEQFFKISILSPKENLRMSKQKN